MDFKKLAIVSLISGFAALTLTACTNPNVDTGSEDVIGSPLNAVTSVTKSDGDDKSSVSIFDETTRQIHQFNLSDMSYLRSFDVKSPDQKHYLISQDQGNYVIDICQKNVSIFNRHGDRQDNVLNFTGNPLSAAFRSDLNLAVIYDDQMSVGIIQLDASGNVLKTWMGGSLLNGQNNLVSGDLMTDGRLVLALNDNSIAVVDVVQTLSQRHWVFTSFATGLGHIAWIAPINNQPQQIFVRATDQVAIVDISSRNVVTSVSTAGAYVEKYSKLYDAHVLVRANDSSLTLYYADAAAIRSRNLLKQSQIVMESNLNLSQDSWTYVDTDQVLSYSWNDVNVTKTNRRLRRYRISDMLGQQSKAAPDQAQLQLTQNFMFALFPSELGYAVRYSVLSDEKQELKLFNMHH